MIFGRLRPARLRRRSMERDLHEIILERLDAGRSAGSLAGLREQLRAWIGKPPAAIPPFRKVGGSSAADYAVEQLAIGTEPGLEISADLIVPRKSGRKPAVLAVNTEEALPPLAAAFARRGSWCLPCARAGCR